MPGSSYLSPKAKQFMMFYLIHKRRKCCQQNWIFIHIALSISHRCINSNIPIHSIAVFNPSTETPTSRMITKSPIVRDMQNWAKNESEKVSHNNTAVSIQRKA